MKYVSLASLLIIALLSPVAALAWATGPIYLRLRPWAHGPAVAAGSCRRTDSIVTLVPREKRRRARHRAHFRLRCLEAVI